MTSIGYSRRDARPSRSVFRMRRSIGSMWIISSSQLTEPSRQQRWSTSSTPVVIRCQSTLPYQGPSFQSRYSSTSAAAIVRSTRYQIRSSSAWVTAH